MPKNKKRVREVFEEIVNKFHPSGSPFISVEPKKFKSGDHVRVTVELLPRRRKGKA